MTTSSTEHTRNVYDTVARESVSDVDHQNGLDP